jgi:hypothetical protein
MFPTTLKLTRITSLNKINRSAMRRDALLPGAQTELLNIISKVNQIIFVKLEMNYIPLVLKVSCHEHRHGCRSNF